MGDFRLWDALRPTLEQTHGAAIEARPKKWITTRSPLRPDDETPSFGVLPDIGDTPGGWRDHGTGQKGSLVDLCRHLGIEPPIGRSSRSSRPQNQAITFERWCAGRGLDAAQLSKAFGPIEPLTWSRSAVAYPASGKTARRVRYIDGKKPKYQWHPSSKKGGDGGPVLYGLDHALALGGDGPVYVVNGEPSAWACWQSGVPAICFCAGEGGVPPPKVLRDLVALSRSLRIVYDIDDTGRTGAIKLVDALRAAGCIDVMALELPDDLGEHGDVDDLHQRTGDDGLAQTVSALPELTKKSVSTSGDGRPVVLLGPDLARVVDELVGHLVDSASARAGQSDGLYRRGQAIARIAGDGSGLVLLDGRRGLRLALSRVVSLIGTRPVKMTADLGDLCATALMIDPRAASIPPLDMLCEAPTVLADGRLLTAGQYDRAAGVFVSPAAPQVQIPAEPTRADALAAAARLLDLLCDMPMSDTAKAAWLLGLLIVVARPAINGPTPLIVVTSNVRGVGKSLLADVVATIAMGREMPRTTAPRDDEEARKRITSIAVVGRSLAMFDNVERVLHGASLDAVLTATVWEDRILGRTELVCVPWRTVMWATGVNAAIGGDLERRVLPIELSSAQENPELRTGFRHPDLLGHVRKHRTECLSDALIIVRAYRAAGCPAVNVEPWGSYEAVTDIARAPLAWLGLPDPVAARRAWADKADPRRPAIRTIIAEWPMTATGDPAGLTSREIVRIVVDGSTPAGVTIPPAWTDGVGELLGGRPTPNVLGARLRSYRDRVIRGRCLRAETDRKNRSVWTVRAADDDLHPGQNLGTIPGVASTQSEQLKPETPRMPNMDPDPTRKTVDDDDRDKTTCKGVGDDPRHPRQISASPHPEPATGAGLGAGHCAEDATETDHPGRSDDRISVLI